MMHAAKTPPARTASEAERDLRQRLAQAQRQSQILQRVIEAIGSGLALEPLLAQIITIGVELANATHGSIGLIEWPSPRPAHAHVRDTTVHSTRTLRISAIHNMPASEFDAEYRAGEGLAGQVLQDPRPVWFDRYGDLMPMASPELAEHAVIGIPIWWRSDLIGFLGIGAEPPRRFNAEDAEILSVFARHVAIAIENARLFAAEQHRASRSAIVTRLGQLITSSLSINSVLQTAVESIHTHLHYPDVALFLRDEDDAETLVLRARSGVAHDTAAGEYRQSIHDGIVGAASRSKTPVIVDDVHSDPRYVPIPSVPNVKSELAVPVMVGDQVLGVLNVESEVRISKDDGSPDAADLQIIADQLGVAIDHARRYEEGQQRSERLALIARTGQRVAARLDPDELFNTLVNELHERLGYDHAALFVLDRNDPDYLVQRACATDWPPAVAIGYRQKLSDGIVGAAGRKRAPELVNDLASATHYISMTDNTGWREPRAELAVPILLGEGKHVRLLGVLDLAGMRLFDREDILAAQTLADQVAVAIDNAELFVDTQRALNEARLLYTTTQRMSAALAEDDVIDAYLEQVAAHNRYVCSVVLFETDDAGRRVHTAMRARWSAKDGLTRPGLRIDYQHDNLDDLLDTGQTLTIDDVQTDPRVPLRLRQIQLRDGRPAMVMIPLMVRGDRIGLVILTMTQTHAWKEADLQPYLATAATLAQAIDNRRQQMLLYERGQQVAILEERQRLARELHDSVTQLIFSTTLIAQSIAPAFKRSAAEGEKRVNRLLELSQTALAEMRGLLFELRSPTVSEPAQQSIVPGLMRLQREGLAAAIQRYAEDIKRDNLIVEIDTHHYPLGDLVLRPPLATEEALYRIAQEALNNVVKHAGAREVLITLALKDGVASLRVTDNGLGLAGAGRSLAGGVGAGSGNGIGLKTMRERAEALHGTVSATSEPGRGTTILASIPVPKRR